MGSACESKRETGRDHLAQGAHNRPGKAEEKLQPAMAEANWIVGMANERVQEAEVMKNLIGVNHSDSSPTHADVQFKALETYRDYLPFTPGSRYRSEWWIFTD